MTRVGIFAGTFDPVHNGHVAFARAAIKACKLDEVIFLPEPSPRNKQHVTSIDKRMAMLSVALATEPRLRAMRLPLDQFSVATALPLIEEYVPDAHLVMLMGSDVAKSLPHWPDASRLLQTVELAVATRTGDDVPRDLQATIVPTSHPHIAASQVRRGQSDAVPLGVRDYIRQHGLYQV